MLKMFLRSATAGIVIALAILYWPTGAAKAPAVGATPLVQVYTTKTCTYCKLLRQYLGVRGIAYTEYDIETNASARLAFEASGGRGVPFVVIGAQRIHGFNPVAVEKALAHAGAAVTASQAKSASG
jgi:glutaredoxin